MAASEPRKRRVAWRWAAAAALIALCLGFAVFFAAASQWGRALLCVLASFPWAYDAFIRPARILSGQEVVPRFRVLRALRATQLHVPHYFLEVDDRSIRGRFALHLSGLWLFQFEPQDWRPRKFPSTEIAVLPPDDDNDSVTGKNYRLDFTGEPFEPVVSTREVPPQSAGPDWLRDGFEPIPVFYDDVLRFFAGDLDAPQTMSQETFDRRLGPQAWRVRARRALRVEACDERVPHYYVELSDLRVLHLSGRYLLGLEPDQAEDRTFPSDVFEPMVVPTSLVALPHALNPLGAPFEPMVAGRKISAEDRDQSWVPRDWARVDRPYDEIAAHFGAVPKPTVATSEPTPPETETSGDIPVPPDDGPPPLDGPIFSTSLDRDDVTAEDDEEA